MEKLADFFRDRDAKAGRQENQKTIANMIKEYNETKKINSYSDDEPNIIISSEERNQKLNETGQITTIPKQTPNNAKTDFILPIFAILFLIIAIISLLKRKGAKDMNDSYDFNKKIQLYRRPTKWLRWFARIHPMITMLTALLCAIDLFSSLSNSDYALFFGTLFDVATVVLAILVAIHIPKANPKAYKLIMSLFGYLLTLTTISLILYIVQFFINYEDLQLTLRFPNYNPELFSWANELITNAISSLLYAFYCILNIIYFYKRKTFFNIPEKTKKMKVKKHRIKNMLKKFNKTYLIYIWLVYIVIQFCFFVPFKTFAPGYEKARYTGTVIKTLWYDEPYTQINFPLLLTQAGVVTVVLGTLYFTMSQKKTKTEDKK